MTMDSFAGSNLDYTNHTTLHPIGFVAMMVLGVALLMVPRRFALLPIIIMACFIAPAQRVVVGGLDFNFLRIMVLFGWARILLWSETRGFIWKPLDSVLICWAVSGTVAYSLLYGTTSALVNRLGSAFDAVGMYFLFRCLVKNWADAQRIVFSFAMVSIPVAVAFAIEAMTRRNAFAVFGGVPAVTMLREGRLRCQGAFAHPIMAGCFWAALVPLFGASWWADRRARNWASIGLVCAGLIVVFSASSTPVMAVFAGMVGWLCFRWRHMMSAIRWGAVLTLVALHLVMKAPVWHLIARLDIVGGSTGWHRYHLIDQCINHFSEWALLGTTSTAHWGWGLADVTNQYVLEAVRGGAITLALFLLIIAMAFRDVGRTWHAMSRNRPLLLMSWALGVCLFVHCMSYIAVSYFGQIIVVWYLLLAMIASLSPVSGVRFRSPAVVPSRPRDDMPAPRSSWSRPPPTHPV